MKTFLLLPVLSIAIASTSPAMAQPSQGCYFADSYGADPTGGSTSDTAMSNIITAIGTNNGCILFGQGRYRFNNTISITLDGTSSNSITIKGQGASTSTLSWPAGVGGISITRNGWGAINISDIKLITDNTSTSNTQNAITLTQGSIGCMNLIPVTLENILIEGADGPAQTKFWPRGVSLFDMPFVNIRGLTVVGSSTLHGDGVKTNSDSQSCKSIVLNIAQANFMKTNLGFDYGFSEGVTISQTNFTNGSVGISDQSGASAGNQCQLAVSDSQFDTVSDSIQLNNVGNVFLHDNLFFVKQNHGGVVINSNPQSGGWGYTIKGNQFFSKTMPNRWGWGVFVIQNQAGSVGTISGNVFTSLYYGIVFNGSNATGWNVQSNAYYGNAANVINNGTNNTIGSGANLGTP